MPIIRCSALLFDLDGVLIDSTPAVERVWTRWALQRGFDPKEVVHRAHGRPSIATLRDYLPGADHEAENLIVEQCEIDDLEGVAPLPGALKLLDSLPRDRWTIVTSCTRPLAEVRIRAAGLPIPDRFLTATDVVNGKPDPEPYLKGAALLGFPPGDCVVFEDVPVGIRAAKSAGARVIAFTTTVEKTSLIEAGADWVVENSAAVSARSAGAQGVELEITGSSEVEDAL